MGIVAPAMIIAGVCGLTKAEETMLIQASLIMTGLVPLIQLFPIGKKIGTGLPIIMGAAFAYVPVFQAVGGQFGIGTILGAEIAGGIVAIIVGLFIKYIRHLFPAVVTGTVIFTIGLSLYPIAIRWMAGGVETPLWGTPQAWLIAIITLFAVFVLGNYGKGFLSLGSLLFGIVIGTIVSLPFGMLYLSAVGDSAWVAVPEIMHFQLEFQPAAMATVAIVYVANCLQNMGGVAMTVNAVEGRVPTSDEYAGGIISLGVMSILGAFVAAIPQSTFEQNTGIIISNGVKNRPVFTFACLVFIVAGFLPKFAAVLICNPQPVVGGAAISSFALVVSTITAILLNICLPKGEENLEEARVEAQMSGSIGED